MFHFDTTHLQEIVDSYNEYLEPILEYQFIEEIPLYFQLFQIKKKSSNEAVKFTEIREDEQYYFSLFPHQESYSIFYLADDSKRYFYPTLYKNLNFPDDLIDKISFFTTYNEDDEEWYYWNSEESFWSLPSEEFIKSSILAVIDNDTLDSMLLQATENDEFTEIEENVLEELQNDEYLIPEDEPIEIMNNKDSPFVIPEDEPTEMETDIELPSQATLQDESEKSYNPTENTTIYTNDEVTESLNSCTDSTDDEEKDIQTNRGELSEFLTENFQTNSQRREKVIRKLTSGELFRDNMLKKVAPVDYLSVRPEVQFRCSTKDFRKYDKVHYQDGRGNLENIMESEVFPFTIGCGENRILVSIKCNMLTNEPKKEPHVLSIARDWSGQFIVIISSILNEKLLTSKMKGGSAKNDTNNPITSVIQVVPIIQKIEGRELVEGHEIKIDGISLHISAHSKQLERFLYNFNFILQLLNSRKFTDIEAIHNQFATIDFCKEVKKPTANTSDVEKILTNIIAIHKQEKSFVPLLQTLREIIRDSNLRDHLLLRLSSFIKSNIITHSLALIILEQIIICPQPIRKITEVWTVIVEFLQNIEESLKPGGLLILMKLAQLYEASLTYSSKQKSLALQPFPLEFLTGVSILSRRERDVIIHMKRIRSKSFMEGVYLCIVKHTADCRNILSSNSSLPLFQLPNYSYAMGLEDGLNEVCSDVYNRLLQYRSLWATCVTSIYQSNFCLDIERSLGQLVQRIQNFCPDFGLLYDRVAHFPHKKVLIIFTVDVIRDKEKAISMMNLSSVEEHFSIQSVNTIEHEFLETFLDIHPMRPLDNIQEGYLGDRWVSNCINYFNSSRILPQGVYISIFRFRMTEDGFQIQVSDSNRHCIPYVRIGEKSIIDSQSFVRWIQTLRAREYCGLKRVSQFDLQCIRNYIYHQQIEKVPTFRARFLIAIEMLKHDYKLDDIGFLYDSHPIHFSDSVIHIPFVSLCTDSSYCEGIWKDVDVFEKGYTDLYFSKIFEAMTTSCINKIIDGDFMHYLDRNWLKGLLPCSPCTTLFHWLQNGAHSIVGDLSLLNHDMHRITSALQQNTAQSKSMIDQTLLQEIVANSKSADPWLNVIENFVLIDEQLELQVIAPPLQSKSTEEIEIQTEWVRFPNEDEDDIDPHFISPFSLAEIDQYNNSKETNHLETVEICWNIIHETIDLAFTVVFKDAVQEAADALSSIIQSVEIIETERQEKLVQLSIKEMYHKAYSKRQSIKKEILDLFFEDITSNSAIDIVQNMTTQFSNWVDDAANLLSLIMSAQGAFELYDELYAVNEKWSEKDSLLFESLENSYMHLPAPIPFLHISLKEEIKDPKDLFSEKAKVKHIDPLPDITPYSQRQQLLQSVETGFNLHVNLNKAGSTIYLVSVEQKCFVAFLHNSLKWRSYKLLSCSEIENPIVTTSPFEAVQIVAHYLSSSSAEGPTILSHIFNISMENIIIEAISDLSRTFQIPVLFVLFNWILKTSAAYFRPTVAASFFQDVSLGDFFHIEAELSNFFELVDNLWFLRSCSDFPEISDTLTYLQHQGAWKINYAKYRIEVFLRYRIQSLPQSHFRSEVLLWKEIFGPLVHRIDLAGCATICEDEIELVLATCCNLKVLNIVGTNVIDLHELINLYKFDHLQVVM